MAGLQKKIALLDAKIFSVLHNLKECKRQLEALNYTPEATEYAQDTKESHNSAGTTAHAQWISYTDYNKSNSFLTYMNVPILTKESD